jgi:hypothetical protein
MGCTASQDKHKHKTGQNNTAPGNDYVGPDLPEDAKKGAKKNFGLTKHTIIKVCHLWQAPAPCARHSVQSLPFLLFQCAAFLLVHS